ncbi:hypothetical protein [Streptomyces sp. TR06-5]|uniref:hypothetical protein n=1 Tax=unclassified Streptomyces TaxID=2593676 RepID=UPI00399FCD9C
MYLVHLHLVPPAAGEQLPAVATTAVTAGAGGRPVEHVVVHSDTHPCQVVGLFLQAGSLAEAESAAALAWRGAVSAHPELRPWNLVRAEAPLFDPDRYSGFGSLD